MLFFQWQAFHIHPQTSAQKFYTIITNALMRKHYLALVASRNSNLRLSSKMEKSPGKSKPLLFQNAESNI
jgi:hypothetical protein